MASEEATPKKSHHAKPKRAAGKKGVAPVLNLHLTAKSEPIDTTAKDVNKTLADALAESNHRQAQLAGLLRASRVILEYHDFETAARIIFDAAKELTGATAGYVALLAPDGSENEVLFLDSGGQPCSVDPSLPMPIRGLRAKAYRTGKAVFDNEFATSNWMKLMPAGHAPLNSVMFAPLVLDGKAVGLLGLANKPGGFVEEDTQLATGLGELAAIALKNSRMLEALEASERRFRTLMETASDAIICADGSGRIILWNKVAESIFGYSSEEATGKSLDIIMPERRRKEHAEAMRNLISGDQPHIVGKTVELVGLRKDGEEFPIELSLASWAGKEDIFFTGIIRDITDRKESEAQIAALAKFPSENPNPVLRVAVDGEILYHNEAGKPLLEAWGCLEGQPLSGKWHGFAVDTLHTGRCLWTELEWRDRVFSLTYAPVVNSDYVNVYALDITDRNRAEEELSMARNELETRVQQRTESLAITIEKLEKEVRERKRLETEVLRIGELERQRIGQDLHDSLGQMLGGISFLSRVLHRRLSDKNLPESSDAAKIEAVAMDSIKLTRSLAKGLNPLAQRPDSLMIAMKDLAWNTENMFAIRCTFECEEPVLVDDLIIAAHIHRITQEAITNAVRHGKASNIQLALTRSDDSILMTVKDDGAGLPDEIPEGSGIGFRNMRYRAESIQASLKIEPNPDGGTIVSCHIPTRSIQ